MSDRIAAVEGRVSKHEELCAARYEKIDAQLAEIHGLVAAWAALQTGGKFVRWIGGIIMSVAIAFIALKDGFSALFGGQPPGH